MAQPSALSAQLPMKQKRPESSQTSEIKAKLANSLVRALPSSSEEVSSHSCMPGQAASKNMVNALKGITTEMTPAAYHENVDAAPLRYQVVMTGHTVVTFAWHYAASPVPHSYYVPPGSTSGRAQLMSHQLGPQAAHQSTAGYSRKKTARKAKERNIHVKNVNQHGGCEGTNLLSTIMLVHYQQWAHL
ncbi:hypothetical protein C8R48DRAFT_669814 [Suillus tomentosus]|nr:hypothetical protein C8R48DRAFT_669814 [Suillus tomentosus]